MTEDCCGYEKAEWFGWNVPKYFLLYFVYGWLVLWLVEAAVEVDGKVVNDINGFANCLIDFSLYSKHNQSSHIEQHG